MIPAMHSLLRAAFTILCFALPRSTRFGTEIKKLRGSPVSMSDETSRANDPSDANKSAPIRVVLTKELEARSDVAALVENLPKWRDGALVLAGLAYVLGYSSWAIFAYDHGLGLAPVLDAQYFAAGVLPAAIVIASCFVAWCLRWLARWTKRPVSVSGERLKTILEAAGTFLILLGFVLLFGWRVTQISNAWGTAGAISIIAGIIAVIVSSFFSRDKTDVLYHRFLMIVAWLYLPLIGILAFLFYTSHIFPGLPQEFGGPRRQRVQLDFDVSKVSANTLHLLAPEWQDNHPSQSGIVRSRSLNLVFQNSEYLFLQADPQTPPLPSQVLKLKTSSVECLLPVAD